MNRFLNRLSNRRYQPPQATGRCQASPVTALNPRWRLHPQPRPVVVHESGIALFCTLTPTGRRDQPSVGARVRFRYEPPAFYGFLQTPPLASDALAIRILFPMNRARSLKNSDWVCQLRWANKRGARRHAEASCRSLSRRPLTSSSHEPHAALRVARESPDDPCRTCEDTALPADIRCMCRRRLDSDDASATGPKNAFPESSRGAGALRPSDIDRCFRPCHTRTHPSKAARV